MAGEVVVDALPYIDQGYDEPGVREAAKALSTNFVFCFLILMSLVIITPCKAKPTDFVSTIRLFVGRRVRLLLSAQRPFQSSTAFHHPQR
uniref:Uncharacterized protein n=1 Tax=Timema monikensis TaxID=170555 RepID=A0A7R9E3J9_9NEOP|nr:unnamed protein product [Timema monikensis]